MDVLIIERDKLIGSLLADTLDSEDIPFGVASDEEALALPRGDAPRVVITGLNRGHNEDMTGLRIVAAMRDKWPQLCAVYLATLWPMRLHREALAAGERFLTKPVRLAQLICTVRELLNGDICRRPGTH